MPKDQKKLMPINYTHREFASIRDDLIQIAERFYPDTFQDFSEASFASMMVDAVAYVGDQLSFYLDYNVNEAFLDTAYQYTNVVRHGRTLGYKTQGRPSTYGEVSLFILVPASATGIGPDSDYLPVLRRGSTFSSNTGLSFVLISNVDFANPRNFTVAARIDETTGAPTHYAVRAYGNIVSGNFDQETVTVNDYERFLRVNLTADNVAEIISVFDAQGKQYYEVEYLAQDMVFKEIVNSNYKNDNVPALVKPFLVSRKFTVEFFNDRVALQFGSGKATESNVVANPQNIAADVFGKKYITDSTFDPTRISKNETFGIVPANTTLIVTYRTTNPLNSNVAAGGVSQVATPVFEFKNEQKLTAATIQEIVQSLEALNAEPISGDVTFPSSGEVKRRIFDTFPTQNRAVTQADYENVSYRMPSKYGAVKRVSAQRDANSQKRNINLYVLSEDTNGKLITANSTIKNNLKTWINNYRMINDTVDILDPYIINFGIQFVVKAKEMADKYSTLDACVGALGQHYAEIGFIGEPLYVSDVYQVLKDVENVLDVLKVKIVSKTGGEYSTAALNISSNMSADGSYLIVPKNAIIELKFPAVDIVGKVK
ncbi:hypothetical protein CMI47_06335 [Candidatus Pacearchaeota archaeon]|nr:hypothetical protein [Candidatus Pacearchaeota archaeon]|tara:strand:- start:671 stop:2467 length:1797 start_codon:yes stop_codon:yes gene_type:complete